MTLEIPAWLCALFGVVFGFGLAVWLLLPALKAWEQIKGLSGMLESWRAKALAIDRGICGEEELAQRDTLYQCADQVEAALKPCNTTT